MSGVGSPRPARVGWRATPLPGPKRPRQLAVGASLAGKMVLPAQLSRWARLSRRPLRTATTTPPHGTTASLASTRISVKQWRGLLLLLHMDLHPQTMLGAMSLAGRLHPIQRTDLSTPALRGVCPLALFFQSPSRRILWRREGAGTHPDEVPTASLSLRGRAGAATPASRTRGPRPPTCPAPTPAAPAIRPPRRRPPRAGRGSAVAPRTRRARPSGPLDGSGRRALIPRTPGRPSSAPRTPGQRTS
mmetsp:Transcript_101788/g.314161  ORF Transcript_101788/g.314161 Transcript_101788/m.314161 type:complete len:246 (-) Transcript_101788:252-989(-)